MVGQVERWWNPDQLPFEEVWLDEGSGSSRRISASEFLALDMRERIRHILSQTVRFVNRGETLPTSKALLALYEIECDEHAARGD